MVRPGNKSSYNLINEAQATEDTESKKGLDIECGSFSGAEHPEDQL